MSTVKTAERLTALADGTYAIVMTLLVIEFHAPEHFSELGKMGPEFLCYALSFALLGSYWIAHHNIYTWVEHSNHPLQWLNIVHLISISLIPFCTSLLIRFPNEHGAQYVYLLNVTATLLSLLIMWEYAHWRGLGKAPDHIKIRGRQLLAAPLLITILVTLSLGGV